MKTQLQKWGNSLSVRIPKPFAEELGLTEHSPIILSLENGKIIMTPEKYLLKDLLSQITKENIHAEIDFGEPQGNEQW